MNYGKKSVKQKKKALQSTSSKLGRKCLLTFSKVLLLCVIAIGIIGICAGLGVFCYAGWEAGNACQWTEEKP